MFLWLIISGKSQKSVKKAVLAESGDVNIVS